MPIKNKIRPIYRFLGSFAKSTIRHFSRQTLQLRKDIYQQIENYQACSNKNRKIVFYTAILGNYDTLLIPDFIHNEVTYVCFSDKPLNDYGIWNIRQPPYFHQDSTRIARYIKLHPHLLFPEYEVAVWLDANIFFHGHIMHYIQRLYKRGSNFGTIAHTRRNCFYEEAEQCKRLLKDDSDLINRQVAYYQKNGLEKKQGLFETNFMITCLTDAAVQQAFQLWWEQIESFSRRDQLGLPWVLKQTAIPVAKLLPEGFSVHTHPDFLYFQHSESRKLKLPPKLFQIGAIRNPCTG